MNFTDLILTNLVYNEQYTRKVIPFIKEEYFSEYPDKILYNIIDSYIKKYNKLPSKEALFVDLDNVNTNEETNKKCKEIISNLQLKQENLEWLVDKTEEFCQERAIHNALFKSIEIVGDKSGKVSKGLIPQILSDALAVSFDTHIGHDFIADYDKRYEFYHNKEIKISFDLEYFNKITNGGLSRKTLNIILAGTGVGKSFFMCHFAAANLLAGLNVLYITMEMAEEKIAERIDANLMNITIEELKQLPKDVFESKVHKLNNKTNGRLIIKEYPTANAGAANFRHLINELRIKKKFIPDIIYIDYINICMSSRLKAGANVNSYTYVKAIAEELRGLAVEFNVPVVSATQTTRGGYNNSDIGLEDTSESFGLPATADLMFALISTEELEQLNQIMVKQLKNRDADPSHNRRFVVGIDRAKMKLYDVEQNAQEDILDGPIMDKTTFGEEEIERSKKKKKFSTNMFDDFV